MSKLLWTITTTMWFMIGFESPVNSQDAQTVKTIRALEDSELLIRQAATKSLGDKFAWNPDAMFVEVGLTREQSKLVAKGFKIRLEQREQSIERALSRLAGTDSSDKKSYDDVLAVLARDELSHENMSMEKIEEILLPKQFELLLQSLIRADNLGFADIPACVKYLDLTASQQSAFLKARDTVIKILTERAERGESNSGVIPENEKIGETIIRPVQNLSKSQLEKYLHSRKMVDASLTLEDHLIRLNDAERDKLVRVFPVLRNSSSDKQNSSTAK